MLLLDFTYHMTDLKLKDTYTGVQPEPIDTSLVELKLFFRYMF